MSGSCNNGIDSLDALFEILSDQRRRAVLFCLKKYKTPVALADLAQEVAIQEQEASITEVAPEDVKQTYLSLYHIHIPKLADRDIIEYDQEKNVVALKESSEQLKWCFKSLESR